VGFVRTRELHHCEGGCEIMQSLLVAECGEHVVLNASCRPALFSSSTPYIPKLNIGRYIWPGGIKVQCTLIFLLFIYTPLSWVTFTEDAMVLPEQHWSTRQNLLGRKGRYCPGVVPKLVLFEQEM